MGGQLRAALFYDGIGHKANEMAHAWRIRTKRHPDGVQVAYICHSDWSAATQPSIMRTSATHRIGAISCSYLHYRRVSPSNTLPRSLSKLWLSCCACSLLWISLQSAFADTEISTPDQRAVVLVQGELSMSEVPAIPTIIVLADTFELRLHEERAIWRGNVTATQGGSTFRASQLTLRLDQLTQNNGQSGSGQQAPTVAAPVELQANQLTYDKDSHSVHASGNTLLRRGHEIIQSERLQYALDTRIAYAHAEPGDQVKVRFYNTGATGLFGALTAAE